MIVMSGIYFVVLVVVLLAISYSLVLALACAREAPSVGRREPSTQSAFAIPARDEALAGRRLVSGRVFRFLLQNQDFCVMILLTVRPAQRMCSPLKTGALPVRLRCDPPYPGILV
jgi:hypothetical protein